MVRPTAARLTVPLSRAKDTTALASVLHVLGTRSRLETIQLLLGGPKPTNELPVRLDELHMLEDIGIVVGTHRGHRHISWALVPGALDRIAGCANTMDSYTVNDGNVCHIVRLEFP